MPITKYRNIPDGSWQTLREAMRQIYTRIDQLEGNCGRTNRYAPLDMQGNLLSDGPIQKTADDRDYITKSFLKSKEAADIFSGLLSAGGASPLPTQAITNIYSGGGSTARRDLFANRGNPSSFTSQLFLASDRNDVSWYSDGSDWYYFSGIMFGTITPDLRPTGLTTTDKGFMFWGTDTLILYVWDGAVWKSQAQTIVTAGTYGTRPVATAADNGKIYYATDQTTSYLVVAGAWVWFGGLMYANSALLPALAAGDAGFLFYATNTSDLYIWEGAWFLILSDRIEQLVRSEGAARGFPAVTGHPTMRDGEMMFEVNTDDSNKMYLWHRKGATYYWFVQDGSI